MANNLVTSNRWPGREVPWIRDFEMAAIAPDLFDTTYYSIDPHYAKNYLNPKNPLDPNFNYDLGFLEPDVAETGVNDQIEAANEFTDNGNNYFIVKDKRHLLTGWTPSGAFEYLPDPSLFGQCEVEAKNPFPSGCASGGRVGYSVKLISRDYLMSDEHRIGGMGAGPGQIRNPPPDDF